MLEREFILLEVVYKNFTMCKASLAISSSRFAKVFAGFAIIGLIQAYSFDDINPDKPEVYNVRCDVKDLTTTIKWNVTDINDSLELKRYTVRFCTPTACIKQNLHCYEDETRTTKLKRIKETSCKASIAQLPIWGTYRFLVTAVYKNLTSGNLLKTTDSTICEQITRQTTLSAPRLRTLSTTFSITINLDLPENLQNALNIAKQYGELKSSDVTYHYQLSSKGQVSNGTWPLSKKISLNNYETYENIAPNEEYEVQGWYRINSLKYAQSENATASARTKPDPFPQWAQIVTVCAIASVVVLTMITAMLWSEFRKRQKKVNDEKFRSTEDFEKCLRDICNADPRILDDETDDDERNIIPKLKIENNTYLDDGDGVENMALSDYPLHCPEPRETSVIVQLQRDLSINVKVKPHEGDYDQKPPVIGDYSFFAEVR